jgi:hypothetical protein
MHRIYAAAVSFVLRFSRVFVSLVRSCEGDERVKAALIETPLA